MLRLKQQLPADRGSDRSDLQEIIAASGISVRLWRLYAYFWLMCLFFPVLALIQMSPKGLQLLIAVLGLVIFITVYFWVMWPHPLSDQERTRYGLQNSLSLLIALTGLALLLSMMYGSSFLWLFIGVSAIAGITLPFRSAAISVFALTLLTLAISVGISGSLLATDWLHILPLILLVRGLGLDMIGFVRLADALRELHHARKELAYQAVTEERLRMARDLHDLLGHTLSLITLKSELVGRLLEKDPLTASQEIHEVERVARQALREVREAVAGYRQQTLRGELDAARQILEAAGIDCTIEYDAQVFLSEVDSVLGWVVREGVTNVIRHSRAKHCSIRITSTHQSARVEVSNDGYPRENHTANQASSGLSGLAERVAKQDGRLEAGPQSTAGIPVFRLLVDIPIKENVSMEVR
jgi:two-component system, NarL family, sensor histidine kinase DesK